MQLATEFREAGPSGGQMWKDALPEGYPRPRSNGHERIQANADFRAVVPGSQRWVCMPSEAYIALLLQSFDRDRSGTLDDAELDAFLNRYFDVVPPRH